MAGMKPLWIVRREGNVVKLAVEFEVPLAPAERARMRMECEMEFASEEEAKEWEERLASELAPLLEAFLSSFNPALQSLKRDKEPIVDVGEAGEEEVGARFGFAPLPRPPEEAQRRAGEAGEGGVRRVEGRGREGRALPLHRPDEADRRAGEGGGGGGERARERGDRNLNT